MPRRSRKAIHIKALWEALEERVTQRELRTITGRTNAAADRLDLLLLGRIRSLESKRYLYRSKYRKSSTFIFERDMNAIYNGDVQPWLNSEEFLQKYRMSRENFHKLADKIRDCDIFKTRDDKPLQYPVEYQLMVFLFFVGQLGATDPQTRNMFNISRGTANLFRKRIIQAILSLKDDYVYWPDAEEREEIAQRIMEKYLFPNCVGFIDGTLFPLFFRPQSKDAPDYFGRKCRYSFSVPIVCDDTKRIRYYLAGWPGSTHDNRIWKNSDLYRNARERFSELQYMLGDSAYECSQHMVAAFRNFDGHPLENDENIFNTALASPRVLSEHTIGILKGRFPWLQSIKNKITDDVNSRRRVISMIGVCIILHNFLIEETTPDDFMFEDDDKSTLTSQEPLAPDDELNQPVPDWATGDTRRTQLKNYILELRGN